MRLLKNKLTPTRSRKRQLPRESKAAGTDARLVPLVDAEGSLPHPPPAAGPAPCSNDDGGGSAITSPPALPLRVSPLHIQNHTQQQQQQQQHRGSCPPEEVMVRPAATDEFSSGATSSMSSSGAPTPTAGGGMQMQMQMQQRQTMTTTGRIPLGGGDVDDVAAGRSPSPTIPARQWPLQRDQPTTNPRSFYGADADRAPRTLVGDRPAATRDDVHGLGTAMPSADPVARAVSWPRALSSVWSGENTPKAGNRTVQTLVSEANFSSAHHLQQAQQQQQQQQQPPQLPEDFPAGGDYTRHEQFLLEHGVQLPSRSSGKTRSHQSFRSNASSTTDAFDDDAEWTPQDSAYGAACPICGWIPKEVRRIIELAVIVLLMVALVVLVVMTSMRLSNETNDDSGGGEGGGGSNSAASGGGRTDDAATDDYYVDNAQGDEDDDDYFDSNESNNSEEEDESSDASGDGEDGNERHARILKWTSSIIADSDSDGYNVDTTGTRRTRLRRRVGNTLLW